MSEAERVTVTVADGVADVRLNRPDKLNALDPAMFDALVAAGERLAADPRRPGRRPLRGGAGVLRRAGLRLVPGDGRSAAGPGFRRRSRRRPTGPSAADALVERLPGRITNRFQHAAYVWTEMPVPVIAAVHGVALGGGLQIALGADLRIVAPDARLSVLEIRWGLIPDMTGTHMLRRLVAPGRGQGADLDRPDGVRARGRRLGLATRVSDDPREDALVLAAELAARNPYAIRAAKRLLNQSGLVSQGNSSWTSRARWAPLIGSPNQVEAARLLREAAPVFADPA